MADFICPLCQQPNQCLAGTNLVQHCWCMQQQFPSQLLVKAPDQSSCICQSCLQQAQQQAKTTVAQSAQAVQLFLPDQVENPTKAN